MEINFTPLATSKNYQINNFVVADDTFNNDCKQFDSVKTKLYNCKQTRAAKEQTSPIAEATAKQVCNSKMCLMFDKSSNKTNFVDYQLNKLNNSLVSATTFSVKQNVQANVVVTFKSSSKAYANNFLNVECEENACLNICVLSHLKDSQNFINIEANLEKNAKCKLTIIDISNHLTVLKQTSTLAKENANFSVNTLYLGTNNAAIDINIISNIIGKNNKSTINVLGAMFDAASKSFKGTIDFKKGSSGSAGKEDELCLLYSPAAKSKSLPMLLCGEEDVEGSHSSATGKIDDNALFYLMSRGLSKNDSLKLYLKAKFNTILSQTHSKIQKYVNSQIDRITKNYE